jgi:hypothetical protein
MHPWQRQKDEPIEWFERFDLYRLMGPGRRSLLAVYRRSDPARSAAKCVNPAWRKAERDWQWRQRSEAWDLYGEGITQEELATVPDHAPIVQADQAPTPKPQTHSLSRTNQQRVEEHRQRIQRRIDWEEERELLRDRQLTMADKLHKKAEQLMAMPVGGEDGGAWAVRDIVAFVKCSTDLTQAAIDDEDLQSMRRQLAGWHSFAQHVFSLDDAAIDGPIIKRLMSAFLDAQLLELGKPARGKLRKTIEVVAKSGES